MAAKLLSLYLLAVAGLAVVRAAPVSLDQRQDNPNGILSQLPNGQLGQVVDGTDFPVKRAAPLIYDERQVGGGTLPQVPNPNQTQQIGPDPNQTQQIGPGPGPNQTQQVGPGPNQTQQVGPGPNQTQQVGPGPNQTQQIGPDPNGTVGTVP